MIELNLLSEAKIDGEPLRNNNDGFWQELKTISMNTSQKHPREPNSKQ